MYPISLAAFSTRFRVFSVTSPETLGSAERARETVMWEMPSRRAMSRVLIRFLLMPASLRMGIPGPGSQSSRS